MLLGGSELQRAPTTGGQHSWQGGRRWAGEGAVTVQRQRQS